MEWEPKRCLTIIVAASVGLVIGNEGKIPWHLPEDLKRFKALTMGHTLIMGRKTYESIGKPLPGRTSIVVSRQPGYEIPGVAVMNSLEAAIVAALETDENPYCIGGAEVYEQALPYSKLIQMTCVSGLWFGDAVFPNLPAGWKMNATVHRGEQCDYRTYEYTL